MNDLVMEKLMEDNAKDLNMTELFSTIFPEQIAEGLSDLSKGSMYNMAFICDGELMSIEGMNLNYLMTCKAIVEMSKRMNKPNVAMVCSPQDTYDYIRGDMPYMKQEVLRVICLNTKNFVIASKDVSIGTINSSIVHPREIFNFAIARSACSIIICHNHPSGDPTPSNEDIMVTKRLKQAGELIGIELLDHVVCGYSTYVSLREKGVI